MQDIYSNIGQLMERGVPWMCGSITMDEYQKLQFLLVNDTGTTCGGAAAGTFPRVGNKLAGDQQ